VAKRPQSQQRRNRSGPLLSELIEGGAVTYEPPLYVKRRSVVRLGGNYRGLTWKLEVDPIARLRELVERFEASSRMVSPLERWASGLIAGLEEAVLRYEPGRRVPRGPYAKPSLRTARVFLQPRLAVARSLADLELRKPPAKHKQLIRRAVCELTRALRGFESWKDAERTVRLAAWLVRRRWPQPWENAKFGDPTSLRFNAASLKRRHTHEQCKDKRRRRLLLDQVLTQ
jgi:hypothetical protein